MDNVTSPIELSTAEVSSKNIPTDVKMVTNMSTTKNKNPRLIQRPTTMAKKLNPMPIAQAAPTYDTEATSPCIKSQSTYGGLNKSSLHPRVSESTLSSLN